MGFDLVGKNRDFSTNWGGWRYIFKLAIENGWEPAGTKPPDENDMKILYGDDAPPANDWDGCYFSNCLQLVTAEDAANMAEALHRSMEFQVTEYDGWLRDFIEFARGGDFQIW